MFPKGLEDADDNVTQMSKCVVFFVVANAYLHEDVCLLVFLLGVKEGRVDVMMYAETHNFALQWIGKASMSCHYVWVLPNSHNMLLMCLKQFIELARFVSFKYCFKCSISWYLLISIFFTIGVFAFWFSSGKLRLL